MCNFVLFDRGRVSSSPYSGLVYIGLLIHFNFTNHTIDASFVSLVYLVYVYIECDGDVPLLLQKEDACR